MSEQGLPAVGLGPCARSKGKISKATVELEMLIRNINKQPFTRHFSQF